MSSPVTKVTWSQILAVRMRRHMLEQRGRREDLVPLARMLCGFHGQISSTAEQTASALLDGLRPGDLDHALYQDRTLYKSWAMRGTLHVLPSDQFSIWIGALSHLPRADSSASWRNYFGTSSDNIDILIRSIDVALKDQIHTRESLAASVSQLARQPELEQHILSSWGPFLKPSARLGHVCFAPGEGNRVRFTHPLTWLPLNNDVDPLEAVRIVLRQYLHTYGPANRREVVRWFGLGKASVGDRLLTTLDEETSPVWIEGESLPWHALTADIEELATALPSDTVRLLPAFDQFVVNANRGIEAILPQSQAKAVYRAQGCISPTIIRGGRIIGIWTHVMTHSEIRISPTCFETIDKTTTRQIETEAERWAGYFDRPLTIQWPQTID